MEAGVHIVAVAKLGSHITPSAGLHSNFSPAQKIAKPLKPGAPPELLLPLTIQERKLSVGPRALLGLPPIRWQ